MRLAQALRDDDTVITFNWDTLLDRALAELDDVRASPRLDSVTTQIMEVDVSIDPPRQIAPSSFGPETGTQVVWKAHRPT